MDDGVSRVFLHFYSRQIIRTVEHGRYGPYSVVAMPEYSRYAGYTFLLGLDRIHPDRIERGRYFAAFMPDKELRLLGPGDASGRDETVMLKASELMEEFEPWRRAGRVQKAVEESEGERFRSYIEERLSEEIAMADGI